MILGQPSAQTIDSGETANAVLGLRTGGSDPGCQAVETGGLLLAHAVLLAFGEPANRPLEGPLRFDRATHPEISADTSESPTLAAHAQNFGVDVLGLLWHGVASPGRT
jgi:hypothetical protein